MTLEALGTLGTVALVPCPHCGGPRMKMTMGQLRGELRRDPTPLLAVVVHQLGRLYGAWVPIFVCSACKCVTGDSRAHAH